MRIASIMASARGRKAAGPAALLQCLFLGLLVSFPLAAQPQTRAGEIQAARKKKAESLKPEAEYGIEKRMNDLDRDRVIERFTLGSNGLGIRLGGLPTGQGFALGPQYRRQDLADGNLTFRTSAAASLAKALLFDLQLTAPKLAGGKIFLDFYAMHRNSPRVEYFGQGPDSLESNRTNFRLEENRYDFTIGVRPVKPFSFGVIGGWYQPNAGPGNRSDIPSTEQIFTEATTPGLTEHTHFLHGGVFVQFDYRDLPGIPRKGGNYVAKITHLNDRDLNRYDHRRLELEVQQYIPFFNEKRVIALRARSMMAFENGTSVVPFFLQPILGGSDDLRGFRQQRFYDSNLIIANAEYRWEVFSGLDMALFFDAGKVVPKPSQINFHDLETSAGFGFRFNIQNSVFLRIDTGFSHEGTQIWLKFGNVF